MRTIPLFIGAMLLLALAWSAHIAVGANAQANPSLAKLEIDIWPEFDRPATLVILGGELAPEVTLPASVSLRIPTSSGGPAALASAVSADAPLMNIPYERSEAQVDFLTLTFETEDRFFHLEFYDRLETDGASRSYRYFWTGDLRVGELSVQVQQPAGATALSVQPDLGPDFAGLHELAYRQANLGALEEGKSLTVDIAYQKSDARTSAEILGLTTDAPEPGNPGSDERLPRWLIVVVVAGALVLAAAVLTRRRSS